jgi:hypothetical protein
MLVYQRVLHVKEQIWFAVNQELTLLVVSLAIVDHHAT